VNGVSFEVEQGQCLSLLGPSGCGKTTTLRMIAGFEQPDAGEIRIEGRSMAGRRPHERNVGLVFQDYMLFPHMTVRDNVAYGLRRRGVPSSEQADRVRDGLALLRLTGYEERFPRQLSGGEQQRVAIARALATRPPVMLLDEPLSNLDAKLRTEVRGEIREILRNVGTTTIIVTHDQEEAMSMADTIVVMRKGEVMQCGTPDDIYLRPANVFTADFVGRMNWFKGVLRTATSVETGTGLTLAVRSAGLEAGSEVMVGLRPERLLLGEGAGACAPALDAVVRTMEYLGPDIHVHVVLRNGGAALVIAKNAARRPVVGEPLSLRYAAEDCILLPV
jgi:ABC-type Fe3+/spermidine/putrescine transport system ATPase subunit